MNRDDFEEIMAGEFAAEGDRPQKDSGLNGEAASPDVRQAGEAGPPLPDGLGLDYEDVRKMLSIKHETILGKDEPILMMVTLCNVFLGELEKLHKRHNEAVTRIMSDQSRKYIDGVKATTEALSQTLADTSIEAIRKIFDSHAAELNANRLNSRWCAAIIAVSALVNVAILAFGFWR